VRLVKTLLTRIIESTTLEAAKAYADAASLALTEADQVGLFMERIEGGQIIPVIKVLRDQFGLGLAEAKKLCDSAPVQIKIVSTEDGNRIKKLLEEAGAVMRLR
jgi:ribosomal protein L7/L12